MRFESPRRSRWETEPSQGKSARGTAGSGASAQKGHVGPWSWAVAVLAGLSVADPGTFTKYGVYLAVVITIVGSPGRFRIDRVVWITAVLVAWTGMSTLWAINPTAQDVALAAASVALVFVLCRDAIRTPAQLRLVAFGYVIASFVAVIRVLVSDYSPVGATDRYTLSGLNANYLGYALVGALAVVVLLWNTTDTRRGRLVLIGIVGAILLGLELTGTRGAAIGAVCLAIWLVACRMLRRPPIRTLLVGVTALAFVITAGVLDTAIRSLDFGNRATGDWSGRLVLWPIARHVWEQHWMLGSGPHAMRVSNSYGYDAHSVFLEIGSAQGVVGVVLFIAFVVTLLWHDTKAAPQRSRALILGSFIAASGPAYLSGAWEATAASWVLLLIFSRLGVFSGSSADDARVTHAVVSPRKASSGAT